jgi:NADPH:quinone reductase-like Zn-dependent oxidoreductase
MPSMKAVRLHEYGGPEVLQYADVPVPDIADHDVLIRVGATSVTNWDLQFREGKVWAPPGRKRLTLPFQLGREAAGTIEAVGGAVTSFKTGDRVVTMTCPACGQCEFCRRGLDNLCVVVEIPGHQRFGGYAEYVAAREHDVLRIPDSIPFEKAACLLWSYGTVLHMVHLAELQPADDVLVTGASSGMGTAAAQLARVFGARRIIGTTGSREKVDALKELGVDHVLNYQEDEVPARVMQLTGMGVDVALDNIGGPMLTTCLQSVRLAGTVVAAAILGGRTIELDIGLLFPMHLRLLGARASTRREQAMVLDFAGRELIDPVIARVLPLSDAADAHRLLEKEDVVGKIVLQP